MNMKKEKPGDRTYMSFPEALRKSMEKRVYSFPRLSKEIDQKLSIAYIHNLASGKSRPTKENIEIIPNIDEAIPLSRYDSLGVDEYFI